MNLCDLSIDLSEEAGGEAKSCVASNEYSKFYNLIINHKRRMFLQIRESLEV